jgi:hypothetical protein
MIARVATFDELPNDLEEGAIDLLRQTIKGVPGYVAGFHLRDPDTGKAVSVTVYEDAEALGRAGKALAARPDQRKVGIDPDRVELMEAYAF